TAAAGAPSAEPRIPAHDRWPSGTSRAPAPPSAADRRVASRRRPGRPTCSARRRPRPAATAQPDPPGGAAPQRTTPPAPVQRCRARPPAAPAPFAGAQGRRPLPRRGPRRQLGSPSTRATRGQYTFANALRPRREHGPLMAERRLPGLQRVLGVNALFSTAYGNVGSSIYYALGLVASFALGLTPVV